MERKENRRSEKAENEKQPGDMSSFNQRDTQRSTESEDAQKSQKNKEANPELNNSGEERNASAEE